MEGDKGDVESEYQRQQRHLVEPARHKGEPDRQEARAGGKGDCCRRYEIGADDQRGRDDGILQIFDEIAEWHPCKARADLAAIDRISFSLARHAVPQDVDGVSVIGRTASHPGIAFVADAGLPDPVVRKLRATIMEFRDDPAWPELQAILGVADITVLDPQNYAPMASVAA